MTKKGIITICLFSIVAMLSFVSTPEYKLSAEMSVAEILLALGEDSPNLVNADIEGQSAAIGYDIIHKGFSDTREKKSKKQSKHFVCTSCHNVVKEDPDLSISDPEARLDYAVENRIPFLQATTLYGAVNRTSFYNGDYKEQYGDLVDVARNDIREAIQLCATECAQGRSLKDWELESILSYLWTIDLKLNDLDLASGEIDYVTRAISGEGDVQIAKQKIKNAYLEASPANFVYPPEDRTIGYPGIEANPENGMHIYEKSCLHCHQNRRYSYLHLDKSKMSLKWLNKKAGSYSRHSMYQVIRYGVESRSGKRSYMPKYPAEKLSNQQVEDLRSYFKSAS